jgi:hypothetical protein
MPLVRPEPPSHARGSPMSMVVAICLILGALGYVLVGLIGGPQEAGFWLFAAVGGILVYVLTLVDLRIGLSLMILAVGVSPEMEVEGVTNIRVEDFIVPILAFGWLTRHVAQRLEFKESLLKGPILAYLGMALLAAMIGLLQQSVQPRPMALFLGKTLIYFLMYLIILNNTRTLQEFKAYVILLVITALVSTTASMGEAFSTSGGTARVVGPYGETANVYAGYLIMILLLIVGLFLFVRHPLGRFALGVSGAVVFYGVMTTLSRTSYIALMGGLLIFGLLRHRRLLLIGALFFVLIPLLAPAHVLGRIQSIYTSLTFQQQESFYARTMEWRDSWGLFMYRPLGWGPGYRTLGQVDNEYLRVAVDMGIQGLLAFLWLLWRLGKLAFRNFDAPIQDPLAKGYAAGFCMAFIAILIHAIGVTSFTAIRTMESFMLLSGLASALYVNREEWGLVPPAEPRDDELSPRIRKPRLAPKPL